MPLAIFDGAIQLLNKILVFTGRYPLIETFLVNIAKKFTFLIKIYF
jgi:hypothetical protein